MNNSTVSPRRSGFPADALIRFAARMIDIVIVGAVLWIVAIPLGMMDNGLPKKALAATLFAVLMLTYFVGFEVTKGTSPGKKLLGLYVCGPGGAHKPDFHASVLRNSFVLLILFYAVPIIGDWPWGIAVTVIGISIFASPAKQGLHDKIAGGTQVIDVRHGAAMRA
ncbi:RDD family protein [Antrihabitans sp. YC2-6]|uniref:RDD family protein n=1 Tax=Antrihabitans sp. YC2-6 TaxID=2799498 RepID=UPI0018F6D063|nr:RDD family protein [Antrihabitans sp. YC2-6]MBJ8346687.1 RDD family protein [Antrihabitans sp. YC2-6]